MKPSNVVKIVLLLIVASIGVSAWYLYQTNKITDKINVDTVLLSDTVGTKAETSDYRDTANMYTLKYPKTYKVDRVPQGNEGPPMDFSVISQPVSFMPSNAPENNSVQVQAITDRAQAEATIAAWKNDKHTIKTTKINGYTAQYTDYTFKGDAEGYTDHYYLLNKNGKYVQLNFRSKYNHDNITPTVKWDDSKNMQGFLTIVKSVKFL